MESEHRVPRDLFDRVLERRETGSLKWDGYGERYGYHDPNLLPMWVADLDFPAPEAVTTALEHTARKGLFGYPASADGYYQAHINWLKRRHGFAPKPDWLLPAPGVIAAVSLLIRAVSEPGDQILVQPPVYPNFFKAIKANKRAIGYNPLVFDGQRYAVDFADLEKKAPGAKALLLCSPHNPVGRVWSKKELQEIGEICRKHNLFIISDEIHFDLTFQGQTHTVFQTLGHRLSGNSALVTSASKTFNLPGLQPGVVIVEDETIRRRCADELKAIDFTRPDTCCMEAVRAAYTSAEPWLMGLMRYIEDNYQFLKGYLLRHTPDIKVIEPESTYLVWLDFQHLGLKHKSLEEFLVQKAGLVLNQGSEFGPGGESFARMNIGCPRSTLETGLERLARAVRGLEPISGKYNEMQGIKS